jgi:hypothetical protein
MDEDPPAGEEAPTVIVVPEVKYDVPGRRGPAFHPQHSPVSLVNPVSPDPEISDRLPQMGRHYLLPGLPVTHLGAMGEAVAVGVDPARLVRKLFHAPFARITVTVYRGAPVHAVMDCAVLEDIPQFGVEPGPVPRWFREETLDIFERRMHLLQPGFESIRHDEEY